MVAGEASGDLLAGLLLDGVQARWPEVRASGIGGPSMQQRGFEAWWPSDRLSVHGYSIEVLRRYRELLGIRNQLVTFRGGAHVPQYGATASARGSVVAWR